MSPVRVLTYRGALVGAPSLHVGNAESRNKVKMALDLGKVDQMAEEWVALQNLEVAGIPVDDINSGFRDDVKARVTREQALQWGAASEMTLFKFQRAFQRTNGRGKLADTAIPLNLSVQSQLRRPQGSQAQRGRLSGGKGAVGELEQVHSLVA